MSIIMEVLNAGYNVFKIYKHIDGSVSAYIDGPTKKEIEIYARSIEELETKILEKIAKTNS